MGPEQDARTRMAAAVFTLVLVLLLLLIIITSDYSSIDDEDELDDEYPDWLEPPPLIVGEDNEWDGRDENGQIINRLVHFDFYLASPHWPTDSMGRSNQRLPRSLHP